jgi:hypothetical protein
MAEYLESALRPILRREWSKVWRAMAKEERTGQEGGEK